MNWKAVREELLNVASAFRISHVRRFRRWIGGRWSLVQTRKGTRVWMHGDVGWMPFTPYALFFTVDMEDYDRWPLGGPI